MSKVYRWDGGEDDSLHRIYLTKYERIFDRTEPIALYAGKSLRFIETFLECDEDGNEELLRAWFLQYQFDEHGLWDKNEKHHRMRSAIEGVRLLVETPTCWTFIKRSIQIPSDGPQLLK